MISNLLLVLIGVSKINNKPAISPFHKQCI